MDTARSCLFCSIAAGERGRLEYQDELVAAFVDIRPQAPVHLLLVPRQHIRSAADLSGDHAALLARMFNVAARLAAERGLAETGYRLVFNVGEDAGQSVDHLHLHLLGGRHLGWPPG